MEFHLSSEQKQAVIERIKAERELKFSTDAEHAKALGISEAIYSQIKSGKTDNKLDDKKWRLLASRYGLLNRPWQTAQTPSFINLTETYRMAHFHGHNAIVVDDAGNCKTESALYYARSNRNAVYVDCSFYKNRRDMITQVAKGLGISTKGGFTAMRTALFQKLSTTRCLVLLDECGDLDTPGFLEIKALMNAAKHVSGIVLLGADGLRVLIEKRLTSRKVGYAEIFDRVGRNFTRAVTDEQLAALLDGKAIGTTLTDRQQLFHIEAGLIIKANIPDADGKTMQKLINMAGYSFRNLRSLIELNS